MFYSTIILSTTKEKREEEDKEGKEEEELDEMLKIKAVYFRPGGLFFKSLPLLLPPSHISSQ